MIFDILSNFNNYLSLSPHFRDVSNFVASVNLHDIALGRHEISGKGSFALVNEYVTKKPEESFIECHLNYIDIQIMARGIEVIGFCSKYDCTELPYDPEKDFQKLKGELNFITMKTGSFAVFFPADGHMPGLQYNGAEAMVKKIVIKVPVL
jgi:YhcH/YjgK/YiaL family protein